MTAKCDVECKHASGICVLVDVLAIMGKGGLGVEIFGPSGKIQIAREFCVIVDLSFYSLICSFEGSVG